MGTSSTSLSREREGEGDTKSHRYDGRSSDSFTGVAPTTAQEQAMPTPHKPKSTKRKLPFRLSRSSSRQSESSIHAQEEPGAPTGYSEHGQAGKLAPTKEEQIKQEPVVLKPLLFQKFENSSSEDYSQHITEQLDLETPMSKRRPSKSRPKLSRQRSGSVGAQPRPMITPDVFSGIKLKKIAQPQASKLDAEKPLTGFRSSKTASKILSHLYVSGDLVAKNKDMLLENKVTHVVNTASAVCEDYYPQNFTYLTFNLLDSTKEISLLPYILEAIDFIERARKNGGVSFVHCHQGVSRSCTIVIAYLMWYNQMSFESAFENVKEKHPPCSPNANFICQLMEWGKLLTLKDTKDFQLFRIAPHSERNRCLIIKECSKGVKPSVADLDERGAFLLLDPKPSRLYLWRGSECRDPVQYMYRARQFSLLMKAYLPTYKDCSIFEAAKGSVEEQRFLGLLGGEGRTGAAPRANKLYEHDYASSSQNTRVIPPNYHRLNHGSKQLKSELMAKLFLWLSDTNEWEEISNYDGDDLESGNLNAVVAYHPDNSFSCFAWLGSSLENVISEERALVLAMDFCAKETNQPVDEVEMKVVKEQYEPSDFWLAFEAGF